MRPRADIAIGCCVRTSIAGIRACSALEVIIIFVGGAWASRSAGSIWLLIILYSIYGRTGGRVDPIDQAKYKQKGNQYAITLHLFH